MADAPIAVTGGPGAGGTDAGAGSLIPPAGAATGGERPTACAGRPCLSSTTTYATSSLSPARWRLHGMTVLYAENGADGVRMLDEHGTVDIVLMDAMMPEMDGNETTRAIRRNPRFAELPIVFLTAKAMPGDRESSLAAGASDYITKPVDLDELLGRDGAAGCRLARAAGARMTEPATAHTACPRSCSSTTGRRTCSRWRRSCRACPCRPVASHSGEEALKQLLLRRVRADPAGCADAGHGRLRDGRADQAARAHPARPDRLSHGGRLRTRTWPCAATRPARWTT